MLIAAAVRQQAAHHAVLPVFDLRSVVEFLPVVLKGHIQQNAVEVQILPGFEEGPGGAFRMKGACFDAKAVYGWCYYGPGPDVAYGLPAIRF